MPTGKRRKKQSEGTTMDYAATARQILEKVGGESNILSATHCMTRLRLVLKEEGVVNDAEVKAIPGVVGVTRKSGQYQIIIGNNVAKCFSELNKLGNFMDAPAEVRKGKRNPFSAVLDAIAGSIAPIIPAIIGAGMIRVLYIILNFWIPAENSSMVVLNAVADAAFYFLPILIAFSAGKKFGGNPYLAAAGRRRAPPSRHRRACQQRRGRVGYLFRYSHAQHLLFVHRAARAAYGVRHELD